MLLKSPRVTVRPMTRADLSQMATWRPFDNPLLVDSNWPQRPSRELDRWFANRSKDPRRSLYTIADEAARVIGSITLREINERSSARLGITLGADFVNRGYGTEALSLFLDYYFDELGFERMVLDVAKHNRRAIRVYEKLGFHQVGQRERLVGRGKTLAFLEDPRYQHTRRFFRRDWLGRYWTVHYEMALERERWERRRLGNSSRIPDQLER